MLCCLDLEGGQHCELEPDVFAGTRCKLNGRQVYGLHPAALQ